jgi:hypothetical protein
MSIYYVAEWSVRQSDVEACEKALAAITDHIRHEHPSVKSIRVYRQTWGPKPRRAYRWYEEYESLTVMENEPETPRCRAVWMPIEELAMPGTFFGSIWADRSRASWFVRAPDESAGDGPKHGKRKKKKR